MSRDIHLLAVTPYTAEYTLTSTKFDLTTGTAAKFEVEYADGDERTWSGAVLSGAVGLPASSVLITYTFQAPDLDVPGIARLFPVVDSPAGDIVGTVAEMLIKKKFG